jgi:pimeloyl-ACP methyl ester carboxylesterase
MALAYTLKGDGEAVLWLHGLALDGSIWNDFITKFSGAYKHILVDMPGFGKSSSISAPNNLEDIAKAVKEVLDKEGVSKVSIVGHSMGGYVALAMIELYPGLVTRLCMFHSQPFADNAAKKADRKKVIVFIEKNGTEPWMKEFYNGLFAEGNREKLSSIIKNLFDRGIHFEQKHVIHTIEALMNRPDRAKILEQFAGPVLFIVGNEDAAIPAKNSLAQLDIPDVSFVEMLDGVAHMGIFEAPTETKSAIEELLSYPID